MVQLSSQAMTPNPDKATLLQLLRQDSDNAFKPEYCLEVIQYMSQGYSLMTWAGEIGVSYKTVFSWCDKYPKFADAVAIGRSKRLKEIEKSLNDKSIGGVQAKIKLFFLQKVGAPEYGELAVANNGIESARFGELFMRLMSKTIESQMMGEDLLVIEGDLTPVPADPDRMVINTNESILESKPSAERAESDSTDPVGIDSMSDASASRAGVISTDVISTNDSMSNDSI